VASRLALNEPHVLFSNRLIELSSVYSYQRKSPCTPLSVCLSVSLSVSLSLCLSVSLCLSLSLFSLSLSLSLLCVLRPSLTVVSRYEKLLPVYFPPAPSSARATDLIWPWGGYRVQVAGAFNNWEIVDMNYVNKEHVYTVYLEPGVRYQYKFIVDGQQRGIEISRFPTRGKID
jgi:hypothetical protein